MALVLACGKGGEVQDRKTEPAREAATGSAGAASIAGPAPTAGSGSGAGAAMVAGLSPKIKAARCGEPCLFLVDTPYASLLETYKAECGGMETKDLGYGDCKRLDYMRNCIYAAHGLVFKHKKWKVFATRPWYDARAEFRADAISALERANVHELNRRGKGCKSGLRIAGADHERLSAWFKVLPRQPPMPELIFFDNERVTGARFTERLLEELQGRGKISLGGGNVTESYVELVAELHIGWSELFDALEAIQPAPRLIRIDFDEGPVESEEDPMKEGTHVWFAYDAGDQLIAVAGAHYDYD